MRQPIPTSAAATDRGLWTIPNVLSFLRLGSVPVFVWLFVSGSEDAAVILYAVFAWTDFFDGVIARRFDQVSEIGKLLDPLADRIMIDAAVVLLWLDGRLPWPALAVILARDAVLIGGYRLVAGRGYELSVSLLGKTATWVLYAALTGVLASGGGTAWPLWLFWAGLALAVAAAALYVAAAWRSVRR